MSDDLAMARRILSANGFLTGENELDKLSQYVKSLLDWNQKVNLVSRKDADNVWSSHILHSISLLFAFKIPDGAKVVDIGSGGGLPGIPLAILLPDVQMVLIESIKKKCTALADMLSGLGLTNASVINARVESAAVLHQFRKAFDITLARAVAPLKDLISWSQPLVRESSGLGNSMQAMDEKRELITPPCLLAMKGGDIRGELEEVKSMKRLRSLAVHDICFEGIETTGLIDKKIVIVGF